MNAPSTTVSTLDLNAKRPSLSKQIRFRIQSNPQEELSIEELSRNLGITRVQLYRKIRRESGLSPSRLICLTRLEIARQLILVSDFSVSNIAYMVGFSDPKYFSRTFSMLFGKSPGGLKKIRSEYTG